MSRSRQRIPAKRNSTTKTSANACQRVLRFCDRCSTKSLASAVSLSWLSENDFRSAISVMFRRWLLPPVTRQVRIAFAAIANSCSAFRRTKEQIFAASLLSWRKLLALSQTLWSIGDENGENVKVSFHFVLAASQFLMFFFAPSVLQNSSTNSKNTVRGVPMTTRATGTFEVKLAPLPTSDSSEGSPLGRMSIDKQIHGDLEGTS